MKHFYKKPYFFFWISSLFILIMSYVSIIKIGDSTLDINIHDTYFVMDYNHLSILVGFFLFIIGLIYFLLEVLKIILLKKLTIIHTFITILCVFLYPIGQAYFRRTTDFPLLDNSDDSSIFNFSLVVLVILAQIFFILNIIISTIRHFFNRTKA